LGGNAGPSSGARIIALEAGLPRAPPEPSLDALPDERLFEEPLFDEPLFEELPYGSIAGA
jgi:hypothetical protein